MLIIFKKKKSKEKKVKNDEYSLEKKLIILGAILIAIAVSGLIFVINIYQQLPDVDYITTYVPNETTKIYSIEGDILAELHEEENRQLVPLEKISQRVQKAVVALEDVRFYKHHGFDFIGTARAAYMDIFKRKIVQGGSTITQQLTRSVFLTKKKKITRKIAEILLSMQIERRFTKSRILEMYLNQVYWGHNAYGIESAANIYFGKKAVKLNLTESSMLVGLLRGPEIYSPYKNMKRAKARGKIVLNKMLGLGFITKKEYQKALKTKIKLRGLKKKRYKAAYFADYVTQILIDMYGERATFNGGMKVYTTLDYNMQKRAEAIIKKWVEKGRKGYLNYSQAALISMDPRTGYIKAMVGGYDYYESQFNRAVQAERQAGSAFKPFCYLTALLKGFSPESIVVDAPVTFFKKSRRPYKPRNYGGGHSGAMTYRTALAKSVNVAAIKVAALVGPQNIAETARKAGITSKVRPVLSIPLGSNEVKPIDMAVAFGTFANSGIRVKPIGILRIEDRYGNELYRAKIEQKQVFDPKVIYLLVDMMRGVVQYGTAPVARLPGRDVAGKTGTTDNWNDAWFVGFIPQLVTAVWVGNDTKRRMGNVCGGTIPAPIWKEFMLYATKYIPKARFPKPGKMKYVKRRICAESGKLAGKGCPNIIWGRFFEGRGPTEYCDLGTAHKTVKLPKDKEKKEEKLTKKQIRAKKKKEETSDWLKKFFNE